MPPVIKISIKSSWYNKLIFFSSFDITIETEYFKINMRVTNDITQLLIKSSFGKLLQHMLEIRQQVRYLHLL